MNPRRFLALALELARSTDPAHRRSAVSRAYYASFNVGIEFLEAMEWETTRTANRHVAVQHALLNSGDPDLESAGSRLGTAHSNRLKADYELKDDRWEMADFVDWSVDVCSDLIRRIDDCSRDGPRVGRINEAMTQWISATSYTQIRKK